MNADENPYASPAEGDSSAPPSVADLEAKRRYRVAWMWGASGCGYLTLPWWLTIQMTADVYLFLLMLFVSFCLSVVVFIAASSLALLGKPRDIVGAICGAIFGAGLIGISAFQMFQDFFRSI